MAIIFRLNPIVTVFCGILPDLVDKPLAMMGIGGGRYIGHTLLFGIIVVALFFLWKRRFGFAAITGLASHLLLDLNAPVPWFYPFKEYQFSNERLDFVAWINWYLDFSQVGYELIIVAIVVLVVYAGRFIYRRYTSSRHI